MAKGCVVGEKPGTWSTCWSTTGTTPSLHTGYRHCTTPEIFLYLKIGLLSADRLSAVLAHRLVLTFVIRPFHFIFLVTSRFPLCTLLSD